MRRAIALVTAAAAALLLMSSGIFGSTASAADPAAAVQAFVDHVNAADGAAMAASFTDDGYFEDINPSGDSIGIFGAAALQLGFSDINQEGIHVTATSSNVSGSTVTGTVEYSDNITAAAGVTRVIQPFVAQISGDKIASLILHYDESDAQTAQYLQYQIDHSEEDSGDEPTDFVPLHLGGNEPGDAGVGTLAPGVTFAFAGVSGGPQDVEQPAAIRSGTCDDLGDVTQPLVPVLNGSTGNLVSMSIDDLLGSPHALTIADSADNAGVIVSCADITRSGSGVGLPSTGTGGSTGLGLSWLIVGLALAGLGLASGGAFALKRR
jgi:hypothetical protein